MLDRLLCNGCWRRDFEDATVSVLPRHYSDHHPLLLRLENQGARFCERPFRFEAAWFTHEEFKRFVDNNWSNQEEWCDNIKKFTKDIKEWNNNIFGNIGKRKWPILKRLNGI